MEMVPIRLLLGTQVGVKFDYPYHLSRKLTQIFPQILYQILEMEENCQVFMWDKAISYPLSPRKKRKEKEELQSSSPTILVF